jgi:hypothetical protein
MLNKSLWGMGRVNRSDRVSEPIGLRGSGVEYRKRIVLRVVCLIIVYEGERDMRDV